MRYLILGCNGMVGHTVSLFLKERGHDVIGFARRKSPFVETIIGDAFDIKKLENVICGGQYDCVVNCIGILNQFAESNKSKAVFLNAYLPHFLEDITSEQKRTQVIHISTDCVFSGKRGGYTESDFRDGESFYDRSKALGEIENDKDFTLRTSIIGSDLNSNGIGLFNWFMCQQGTIYGYKNVIWTGVTTIELAKCIETIAKERINGLYNVVPKVSISKYDLLKLCNEYIKGGKNEIIPVDEPVLDKSLVNARSGLSFTVSNYPEMIEDLAGWVRERKHLYPHYAI